MISGGVESDKVTARVLYTVLLALLIHFLWDKMLTQHTEPQEEESSVERERREVWLVNI